MRKFKDLTGQTFGRWTVLAAAGHSKNEGKRERLLWLCRCSCGTVRKVIGQTLSTSGSKSCGCLRDELALARNGDKSSNWNGGRYKDANGYIRIFNPTHPNAGGKYVLEHVLVMSQILGRSLEKGETVHHKNGIRDDNEPSNLELWADKHPGGQRVSDLIAFAKELLLQYEPIALK